MDKVVRLARHGSESSFRNAACTAPSIDTFVNSDSTSKGRTGRVTETRG